MNQTLPLEGYLGKDPADRLTRSRTLTYSRREHYVFQHEDQNIRDDGDRFEEGEIETLNPDFHKR